MRSEDLKNGGVAFLEHPDREGFAVFRGLPDDEHVLIGFLGECSAIHYVTKPLAEAFEFYEELLGKDYKVKDGLVHRSSRNAFGCGGSGVGTQEAVTAWKLKLYENYHPAGYGTRVNEERAVHGLVYFTWSRYSSCD